KKTLTPLMIFGVIWLSVVAVSWFSFPGWRESPGGIWTLLGLSAVGVLAFLKGGMDYLKSFKDLTKPDEPKPELPKGNQMGNVTQTGNGTNIVVQEGNVTIHEAPKPEKPSSNLHTLRPPPGDFTGRDVLIEQLVADFQRGGGATIASGKLSGLTGMGGIGKTALGLVVAHKIAENYPDAQIYVDLKGTTTPLSALEIARHVILSFEPTADLRALDENNFQAAYQSVLHGKKALLFF